MLTAEQVAHFETFGFVVLRQAFTPDEMAEITAEFEAVLAEDRHGETFAGQKRQAVIGFLERRPALARLAVSDTIYEAQEQVLGPDFVWVGSDGNLYVGDTSWHPDSADPTYGRTKVAFYLDPVTKDTGCLRVVPGSHKEPLHSAMKPSRKVDENGLTPFGVAPNQVPFFPLESQPGDVVIFHQSTWHASFGGSARRRMFTLNFASAPTKPEHEDTLRRVYKGNLEYAQKEHYTSSDRLYAEDWLNSPDPRVRSMTDKIVAMGLK